MFYNFKQANRLQLPPEVYVFSNKPQRYYFFKNIMSQNWLLTLNFDIDFNFEL